MPLDSSLEGPQFAKAAGLKYVNAEDPGIRRARTGRGFAYLDADGRKVTDPETLDRISHLVIPPAWTEVWICPDAQGHIQVTARDQRGRKQYRYHPRWSEERDQTKYGRMAQFGRALPRLRKRVDADLRKHGLPREMVLAAVVRLLELTLMRVGNDEYARQNKSFGLTTLRDRHVSFHGADADFEFRGKSGVVHRTGIRDRRLARIVRACQDVPGQRLFQYMDADGERHHIESHDVNAYIREAARGPFSAKDFRTWAGTLAAASALVEAGPADSPTAARRVVAACVKDVAARLGNTPAVCRKCYVHPAVIERYGEGTLTEALNPGGAADPEKALLRFLDGLETEPTAAPKRPRRTAAPGG